MKLVSLNLDGVAVEGAALDGDCVLVPLDVFCEVVDADTKPVPGSERPAVCKGDLCIPLAAADVMEVDGDRLLRLDAIAEALNLVIQTHDDRIEVKMMKNGAGLGHGQTPPAFTLPDLFTEKPVSSSDFLGRKVVFYVWASW